MYYVLGIFCLRPSQLLTSLGRKDSTHVTSGSLLTGFLSRRGDF